jgi:nucleoside 2-deoxyribosyltransferase
MQKVYLAGGLKSGWQNQVKKLRGFTFFCPLDKEKPGMTLDEYGTWDLHYIKQCDIVFAYMEQSNPSGIGMSVEIGYAKALNKTIILVLEPCEDRKYLQFMKKVADITFDDFLDGIKYLQNYV